MTAKEAIRIIERIQEPEPYEPQITCDAYTALEMAIEALEKQIPKKPSEGNVHIIYLCPNCGSLDYTIPYCKHCGQRLSFKEV